MSNISTNMVDWSALTPILPGQGPRTRALYSAIRRLIETGMAPPGAKLPPSRDLARRLGVSRASVIAAFEILNAEGFTVGRIGAGTYVAQAVPRVTAAPAAQEAPDRQPAAPLVCELGVATRDECTLQAFRRLMSRHLSRLDAEQLHYGDPRGGLALREAIAAYLRSARGVRCEASQILITSGALHGLDLVARAVIRAGDPVWIEDPCYPAARATLAGVGARLIGVPVDDEGLDPALGEARHPKARAVYVTPSHQFPLGVTLSMRRRLALINWAQRNDAWIIEDDYDSEFRYAGPPLTALQGMDGSDRVAYLGTFSKMLFPGLRVGYAVLPPALMAEVLQVRARSDHQPPGLADGALADLLNQGHFAAHLRRARRRVQAARDTLASALQAGDGGALQATPPQQGLHMVAMLAGARSDTKASEALRLAGVAARPLSPMYVDAAPSQGLVLGFSGFSEAALRAAAETILRMV